MITKIQDAYDRSIDWFWGTWFKFWVWQAKVLRVDFPPKVVLVEVPVQVPVEVPAKGPERPNRKKLTPREVQNIRELHRSGTNQRALAEIYDVNPATVSRIVRGQYYRRLGAA